MRVGDIVFYRPPSIVFKIIRWVTGGNFGHVGIVVGHLGGHSLIVEASPRGVDLNSFVWRKKMPYTIYRIPRLSKVKADAMVNTAFKFVGQKYDFKALYNMAFKKKNHKNDKKQFCSELVFRVLVLTGYLKADLDNPELVSPHKLRKLMEKYIEGLKIIEGDLTSEKIFERGEIG